MILRKIKRHFVPYTHEDGTHRRAHAVSLFALFSYLLILVVFTSAVYLIRLKAPQILGETAFGASEIIALTNAKRSDLGLPPLSVNNLLTSAASAKASDMFANDYWAHNSPQGKTPWNFISAVGYRYLYAGENLARDFSDAKSVVDAWMNSPSHRSNIVDSNFQEIGVAVASGDLGGREVVLVVQMFGTPISQIPTKEPLAFASPPASSKTQPIAGAEEALKASPKPSFSPTPEAIAQNFDTQAPALDSQTTVLAARKFAISKFVSFLLIGFVFILFALEAVATLTKSHLKLRAGIIAHLLLLGFVLLAVWYAVGGVVV